METFTAIEKISITPNLRIQDFEDGKFKLEDVMEEVKYLKDQISNIRQGMTTFLTGLATLNPSDKPQQVFEDNVQRVTALKKVLDDYVDRFKKLQPLLELVNKELDLAVPEQQIASIKPPSSDSLQTTNTATISTASAASKKPVPRKRAYNKKSNTSAATPPIMSNPPPNFSDNNLSIRGESGSEGRPIIL